MREALVWFFVAPAAKPVIAHHSRNQTVEDRVPISFSNSGAGNTWLPFRFHIHPSADDLQYSGLRGLQAVWQSLMAGIIKRKHADQNDILGLTHNFFYDKSILIFR
ncbi:hypothetical protein KCP69_26685 (plasmid) [Salmonella enterica subsp. enterica]|nr:hypothetical protein KCP69_26685 [Salmonella enterica subsp. enterica]